MSLVSGADCIKLVFLCYPAFFPQLSIVCDVFSEDIRRVPSGGQGIYLSVQFYRFDNWSVFQAKIVCIYDLWEGGECDI